MEFRFIHKIPTFNPVGVLATLGVTPAIEPVRYMTLTASVLNIIETQVLVAATSLNLMLKEQYRKDMYDISEYSRFPRFIDIMVYALSNPKHIGVYWDKRGVVQAQFVNTDLLGDIKDLEDIHRMVSPPGTLRGWKGIYIAWLSGKNRKYETIENQRLDIMEERQVAPFWEFIERGAMGGYPINPSGHYTITNFKDEYDRKMLEAYNRCLSLTSLLVTAANITFRNFEATAVTYAGNTYSGYSWMSQAGRGIFVIAGTERLVGGRLVAKGFILSLFGDVRQRWSGWLPK